MNVPLKEGMTDEAYEKLFKPVMRKVMEIYQPEAIVFQSGQQSLLSSHLRARCPPQANGRPPLQRQSLALYRPRVLGACAGADSLAGDRLGAFNLSMKVLSVRQR